MILTSASLQKWVVEEGDMARQLYEADLSEMIKVSHHYVHHMKLLYDIHLSIYIISAFYQPTTYL